MRSVMTYEYNYSVNLMPLFVTGIVVLLHISVIVLVLLQKKTPLNFLHWVFISFIFCFILWTILNYLSIVSTNPAHFILIVRLEMVAVILQGVTFNIFAKNQPFQNSVISKARLFFLGVMAVLLVLVVWTPILFNGTEVVGGQILPKAGYFPSIFPLLLMLLYVDTALVLVKKTTYPLSKRHGKFLGIAHLIFFILGFGLMFIPVVVFNSRIFIPYGPLFTLPLAFTSAYCLIRFKLLGKEYFVATDKINEPLRRVFSKYWGDLSRRKRWDIGQLLFPPHKRFLSLILKETKDIVRKAGQKKRLKGLFLVYQPDFSDTYVGKGTGSLSGGSFQSIKWDYLKKNYKELSLSVTKLNDLIFYFDTDLPAEDILKLQANIQNSIPHAVLILLGQAVI